VETVEQFRGNEFGPIRGRIKRLTGRKSLKKWINARDEYYSQLSDQLEETDTEEDFQEDDNN
jgi:hypothetical protein